jgi:hypothetical protein
MPRGAEGTGQTRTMADFHVYRDRLEIRLTRAEKLLALRRDDLVIPRDAIKSVAITSDPWIWIRGVRAPGASVPLTLAVGVWKFHGGKDFLVLKSKSRAAVVIDIEQADAGSRAASEDAAETGPTGADDVAEGFSRVVVSTQHASRLVEALREIQPGAEGANDDVIV